MAVDKSQQFNQLLGQLYAAVNAGDPAVLGKIQALLKKIPEEPNLLHLAGLASAGQGDTKDAIVFLKRSLARAPNQPEVHNNLANVYAKLNEGSLAETHYRQALTLRPNFQDALKNLGLLLLSTDPDSAMATLRQAVELEPSDVVALTGLGDAHKALEQFAKATEYYQRALALNPSHVTAIHNQALSYKLNDQLPLALSQYEQALVLAPDSAEIHYNYANALFETGQHDKAEQHYLASLTNSPGFVLAHETLHEFYWQSGQHARSEDSYRQAIQRAPKDVELRLSYINALLATGQDEAAQLQIDEALRENTTAALLHAQGRLAANRLAYDEAEAALTRALGQTFDLKIGQDLARLHITQGKIELAQRLVERLLAFAPDNQLSWALQSLCWRLNGDDRYRWLIDYDKHIGEFMLPVPDGYTSLRDFLAELDTVLLGMHQAKFAPSRQTLKSGTQTPGRLLHKPHPVIAAYKTALADVVEQYLSGFTRDSEHPFLRRLPASVSRGFSFSGSWSVKLKPEGFHLNHVHTEGWISSACYITLPKTLAQQEENAGCIKFGESALMLGEREVVERIIRPQAGQLVLFPSYTWHGTFAFQGAENDYRLTAPFDVVPN